MTPPGRRPAPAFGDGPGGARAVAGFARAAAALAGAPRIAGATGAPGPAAGAVRPPAARPARGGPRRGRLRGALAGLALLAAGCTLGPDYRRPAVPAPEAWRAAAEAPGSLADLGWWELFRDEPLQALVGEALTANKDLRVAVARVTETRAALGFTRSAQFPEVNAGADVATQRISEVGPFPLPPDVDPESGFFHTSLDLAFELDLWGRLRRATEAARAELLESEEARRTVVLTLVSDVAQAYFDLLDLDRELDIARRTVASRRDSLELVRLRAREGITSELDVRRAEAELATAAATVPDLERRVAQTENRISVLLGRNPGPVGRGRPLEDQATPPEIPAGLPSALLERRPDIRGAEQRLVAANARIGEARAAFFPQITLTGFFGVESAALSDLFTGPARVWSFGPRVTLPIFNAGRNRARLDAAEARRAQALAQYEQAVQQAFREVEDALVAHRKTREVRLQQEALVAASRRALELADLRYRNGLSTYLDVLDAQRQLFQAELALAGTRRDQLVAVVQVYKALGGGWSMPPSGGGPAVPGS
jgi:multidrug efflux system outer membrane protein